jgi:hypothetical protein
MVSAAIAGVPSECCCLLYTVADFSTVCSGTPIADDNYDLPIVPVAAVIFDFNSAVAGFTNFVGIPAFAGIHIV